MFKTLKQQVAKRFSDLSKHKLFYVQVDRGKVWELYLDGFEDPVEKQGHNCNCCKSFLRQYSGIVAIVDNKVETLWDIEGVNGFTKSIENLRKYIKSLPVTDIFLSPESNVGTDYNFDAKKEVTWEHFALKLPNKFLHSSHSLDTVKGEARTNKQVFRRSMEEIKLDAINTVLDLIAQGSLYRGNEFVGVLTEFKKLKEEVRKVPGILEENFCWSKSVEVGQTVAKIRNTAVGTLLVNLSEDMELDMAVSKFEAMVAPTNYKRPTALVTPKMVELAKSKLEELGMLDSLERRFAKPTDLDIKNILYVDKSSSVKDVFEELKNDAQVTAKSLTKVEEISISDFIANVLPNSKALHILLENGHLNKMVTLLTAVDSNSPLLFKWNNPFSWAYTGGITDAIKERVKQAGGKVDGELRVSLSWHNYDDLDLHIHEPSKFHIHFANKMNSRTFGNLDVDMNAGGGRTREPVENIVWPEAARMHEGRYRVVVHNFAQREMTGPGFTVQIECRGEVFDFEFTKNPKDNEFQPIVEFTYSPARWHKNGRRRQVNCRQQREVGIKNKSFSQS